MRITFLRSLALLAVAVMAIGPYLLDANAQRRRRPKHRTAKPPVTSRSPEATGENPASDDPKIVSTADQTATTGTQKTAAQNQKRPSASAPESEQESLRRTIGDLAGQLTKLTEKLNQMEEQQRSLVDIERLSRAEQRAEGFRTQLRDVQQKETDLQAQIDQVEYALQPENIERAVAMYGTTRPEQARDQRRKQLENQRARLREQFNQLEQSRVKLEAAIATADTEVETLRQRLEASGQQSNQPPTNPAPAPSPRYTPPPQQ